LFELDQFDLDQLEQLYMKMMVITGVVGFDVQQLMTMSAPLI
jgi:hypothetical protein